MARWDGYEEPLERYAADQMSGCWIWSGAAFRPNSRSQLYGIASVKREGRWRRVYAHRLFYETYVGEVPPRFHVHHKCDLGLCVNPGHLALKTATAHARAGPNVRLSMEIAREIRKRAKSTPLADIGVLAAEYEVTTRHVYEIIVGTRWREEADSPEFTLLATNQ